MATTTTPLSLVRVRFKKTSIFYRLRIQYVRLLTIRRNVQFVSGKSEFDKRNHQQLSEQNCHLENLNPAAMNRIPEFDWINPDSVYRIIKIW